MKNHPASPDPIAHQTSAQLHDLIRRRIRHAHGQITFAEYMHMCLYTPGLGYYSAGQQKLGPHGDFTTAPELSPLFSRTLARHILSVFPLLAQTNILEFGAGNGTMAIDILSELAAHSACPDYYYILETSADLRKQQHDNIMHAIPDLAPSVVWLDRMPEAFTGVILANEVCDAMPVHCLHFTSNCIQERYVCLDDHDALAWHDDSVSSPALQEEAELVQDLIGETEMFTELNLAAKGWIHTIVDRLTQGVCYIIDYGYPRAEYYHPQRHQGTLMCHYQHQAHDNPLILPGLQDITAHVDFSLLAQAAHNRGLLVEGFQTQADFLLAGGIMTLYDSQSSAPHQLQQATAIKRLTHPSFMGESFKVLTLSREISAILPLCQRGDQRYRL